MFFMRKSFLLILATCSLLAHSAQAQSPDSKTATLFQTIRNGDASALSALVADSKTANDSLDGYSALMASTLNGTIEEMKLLIDRGAHVNYANKNGVSALWLAVPSLEKMTLLLEHGANANQQV